MRFLRWKKTLAGLVILACLAGALWSQKTLLLAWYCTKQLAQASEESRVDWLDRVMELDTAVVPRLLAYLQDPSPSACENAGAALAMLSERWGVDDPRSLQLLEDVLAGFDALGPTGRQSALQVPIGLLRETPARAATAGVTLAVGTLLTKAAQDQALRHRTLMLASLFVERVAPGQWFDLCRGLAEQGLTDADPNNRVQAVRLALHTARRSETKFLEKVLPLLRDPLPQVRRAAIVALGPVTEILAEDDLLPLLHDPDADVRRVCELALRSRGLSENHILLAGLISAPHPGARLEVLHHLREAEELDIGIWLDRLSRDPSPAVRAAALRAAMSQSCADLRSRIQQIAQEDPSPTVRQLAHYYLNRPN